MSADAKTQAFDEARLNRLMQQAVVDFGAVFHAAMVNNWRQARTLQGDGRSRAAHFGGTRTAHGAG